MKLDILKLIGEWKNITNVIILTHNIDFVFLQSVVVPQLRKSGHPTLTVFADVDCALESFKRQGRLIDGIGIRYRVVPVAMETGFRFHPKAVMLSSEKKSQLFIGSGNLGFGGWRENGELWVAFDSEVDGGPAFAGFYDYLKNILNRVPLNENVADEIMEAFDSKSHPWASILGEPGHIIGKVSEGKSLYEKMLDIVGNEPIKCLTICSPYFDNQGKMVQKISSEPFISGTKILVQNGKTGLSKNIRKSLGSNTEIQPVNFSGEEETFNFIHSKFYAYERQESVIVFMGSANCSLAALSIPGKRGNAEILAYQKITPEEFYELYLSELEFLKVDAELKEDVEEIDSDKSTHKIRILAAHYDIGELRIAYDCVAGIKIVGCFVDELEVKFDVISDYEILAHLDRKPSRVVLKGEKGNEDIRSEESWVDQEFDLRSSSHERNLLDNINSKLRSEGWDINAWTEILKLVHQHIRYMPVRKHICSITGSNKSEKNKIYFTKEDIFSDGYVLPTERSTSLPANKDERVEGIRQMIMSWFGLGWKTEVAKGGKEGDKHEQEICSETEEAAKIEGFQSSKKEPKQNSPEEYESLQARRVIDKVVESMTNPNYLRERPPYYLGIDIKLVSTLLQYGLNEKWISLDNFLSLTHRVWSVLFFSSDQKQCKGELLVGWLQSRLEANDDQDRFMEQLISIDLSISLATWALTVPPSIESPEEAIFYLACAVSVARFPWLWSENLPAEVSDRLRYSLVCTGALDADDDESWSIYRHRWRELIWRGHALELLEKALTNLTLEAARQMIKRDIVNAGEILWQGPIGLCVAGETCHLGDSGSIDVLCLQYPNRDKKFSKEYIVPLKALLHTEFILLRPTEKEVLNNFLRVLSEGFKGAVSSPKK